MSSILCNTNITIINLMIINYQLSFIRLDFKNSHMRFIGREKTEFFFPSKNNNFFDGPTLGTFSVATDEHRI